MGKGFKVEGTAGGQRNGGVTELHRRTVWLEWGAWWGRRCEVALEAGRNNTWDSLVTRGFIL